MMRRLLSAALAVVMIVCLLPLNVMEAKAASAMKASDEIVVYLKSMEGFTAVPRWDYVQWTVGYGNRCPDEHLERYLKEGIPIEEADALFLEQLVYFEDQVNAFIDRNHLTFTQGQFDAVLSLTYNCGAAWLTGDSDLMKAVVNGTMGNTFIGLISQWCTAGGKYLPGLMRRRLTEADMYLHGRYDTELPDSYCYVFFDAGEGTPSALAQGYDCDLYAVPMVTATREGYTFQGWYTAETGGVKVTYLDENMHEMTLYAHWVEGDGEYDGGYEIVPDEGVLVTVTGVALSVRQGPGTSYAVVDYLAQGSQVMITQVTMVGDRPWGKYEKGWISLRYTDYNEVATPPTIEPNPPAEEEEESYEAPIYATIVGIDSMTVYNGPDKGYPKVSTLKDGDEVLIVETYKMFKTWWGRLEQGGWICLDRYVLLHNDQMLAHSVNVTVTKSYLNVRSGPGTNYGWLSSLTLDDVVEILAVEVVDNEIWGRFSGGWISLQYTTFDASKLEQYWHHSYKNWYNVTASTCVTAGQDRRNCKYCDHYETRDLELGSHSFGDWYVSVEATCVEAGEERRDCVYCDVYETRETVNSDHSFGDWYVSQEATCVEAGQERRDCANCDAYEIREIEVTGHSMGQWYVTLEPTYSEEGEERRDCENCDYYETRVLSSTEHSFGEWYVVTEPTCTEEGLMQRDCTLCAYSETRKMDALGHDFTDWQDVTSATCTEGGLAFRVCKVCNLAETVETEATGHSFGQWSVIKAPTCTEDGLQEHACDVCGYSESEVITAIGHTMSDWQIVRQATCTNAGQKQRVCASCDYKETETIAATGHSMGDWQVVREATCTQYGQKRRECLNCGRAETESLPKLDHSYGDWYISVEPTYSEPGEERRDCENCDAYETRAKEFDGQVVTKVFATITVSSLNVRSGPGSSYSWVGYVVYGTTHEVYEQQTLSNGKVWGRIDAGWICLTGYTTLEEVTEVIGHTHSFGDWYVVTPPTCTESGKMRRDCSGCSHYETKDMTPTGHSFDAWYAVTEPTCTEGGEMRRDCKTCSYYETKNVAASGHTFGDWYTVREATATENGLERRDCENCDHFEERDIEATGTTVTKVYATITVASLNIRSGPGSSYSLVGYVVYGNKFEVYEQQTASNGKAWGRIDAGWICLTGYTTLETVEETVEGHTHVMSNWYTVIAATCTESGYMRRDCTSGCDHYETKKLDATGHSYGNWYTVLEATASTKGIERRDCENCDHFEERDIEATGGTTVTKVYATITAASLNIRSGPGSSYSLVGYVVQGNRFEVYEQQTASNGKVWGRIDAGWICLTGYTTLETVEENGGSSDTTEPKVMTVIGDVLNVRRGPGTEYDIVDGLPYGTQVTVYEVVTVNGVQWGRIDQGWVCMDYLA